MLHRNHAVHTSKDEFFVWTEDNVCLWVDGGQVIGYSHWFLEVSNIPNFKSAVSTQY